MRRKKKIEILEALLEELDKESKKKYCDNCHRKFEKWMTKWGSFDECLCLLCHKSKYFEKDDSFPLMNYEKRELGKLKNA